MLPFDPECQVKQTQFFSTSSAVFVFRDLTKWLSKQGIEDFSVSSWYWKLKFTTKAGVRVSCQLLRVDMETVCVEFVRKAGDRQAF